MYRDGEATPAAPAANHKQREPEVSTYYLGHLASLGQVLSLLLSTHIEVMPNGSL